MTERADGFWWALIGRWVVIEVVGGLWDEFYGGEVEDWGHYLGTNPWGIEEG